MKTAGLKVILKNTESALKYFYNHVKRFCRLYFKLAMTPPHVSSINANDSANINPHIK